MKHFIARARVLLNAAPTYLVAAAVVVTAVSDEIAKVFTGDTATTIASVAAKVLAGLAAATAIVRRVAPVLPAERGLLEPPVKTDPIVADPGA